MEELFFIAYPGHMEEAGTSWPSNVDMSQKNQLFTSQEIRNFKPKKKFLANKGNRDLFIF